MTTSMRDHLLHRISIELHRYGLHGLTSKRDDDVTFVFGYDGDDCVCTIRCQFRITGASFDFRRHSGDPRHVHIEYAAGIRLLRGGLQTLLEDDLQLTARSFL